MTGVGFLTGPIVVIQQAADSCSAFDPCVAVDVCFHRNDQPVFEALMIAFLVIMVQEFANTVSQRIFPEENHLFQTLFFDASYKALGVGVRKGRQLHRIVTMRRSVFG